MNRDVRPIVLITGATGNIGRSLAAALDRDYSIVGLDLSPEGVDFPVFAADFSNAAAVELALTRFRERFGTRIASVIHLVAFFDFTGEDNPLYRLVNVEGTRSLLQALQSFEIEQFVYASTMLVHSPCRPGEHIDETQPIKPGWAYPKSKAEAETVIRAEHGHIPCVLLRLAGIYDEVRLIPTLARQIARIYERDPQSYLYAGSVLVGQSMLHKVDMADAFHRAIDRRGTLPREAAMLVGERDPIGYDALQDEIGYLIHGVEDWPTLRLPSHVAAAGAWGLAKLEPVIPDAIDKGEEPFVRPYMTMMANDHYALDTTRAHELLGWEPQHRLKDDLPAIIANLKRDPIGWYTRHKITPPAWLATAAATGHNPERLRTVYVSQRHAEHRRNRWAHFTNIALGTWLITAPPLLGIRQPLEAWSDVISGSALIIFAAIALSWRMTWARWASAAVGFWLLFAPLVFWTTSAAAYLNDTLVGIFAIGFALALPPEPGVSPVAAMTGPAIPRGWTYNPSAWTQRLPIVVLALVGLYVSRYLAGYQLGHIDHVWEPFFRGAPDNPRNGIEEIITSAVAKTWPISDGGLGGITYVLEILTGIIGLKARWRTMPWLVILFGLMIVPLSVTSITFVIIQPIVIGTWGTLTLIGAAAMLLQIPYAVDELIASLQFLRRRVQAGQNWVSVFFVGDTDDEDSAPARPAAGVRGDERDEFDRSPLAVLKDMTGGVSLPWNLLLSGLIGLWLLFTRLTLGSTGAMANADHVMGFLVLTILSIAAAEPTRAVRYLNVLSGLTLLATPFLFGAGSAATIGSMVCGVALIVLSLKRGPIRERYGAWTKLIV
jgi:nucleoside-diphosphate-sugar epimerase